ncbi:uncharacterized protein A1O9_05764 [Exophiala aquamarina CBS 119918]|uniref:DUF1907 domain-containing protein n=1 Tax=Exophiala aquamarina CBS 119918 TaxID=1182545 RepID=A0A072PF18_9EURO|nr:uncharacterized protein A1O9_05764 [Exophiala aquamarina CBS 119918]KEF57843.1 hypothetical protein A1O9_05764 [Exophiala aquamarina CBS 119918]
MPADTLWPVKKATLSPPTLPSLASAIAAGLCSNFAQSSCSVATPPDLTLKPFHLAASGLAGATRVVDVGGPPHLQPTPDLSKEYDLLSISQQVGMNQSTGFMLGAGAGPFHVLGQNSELMPNFAYGTAAGSDQTRNRTHYAKITSSNDVACCQLPDSTGFGLMCNLFCSDGLPGPCLHITAKSRVGPLNFTETIQDALKSTFGDQLISLGGVFLIKQGKANLHVMPDFLSRPFGSRKEVEEWLRYFDMQFNQEDPLICLSVLHSGNDGGMDLRMEHTHCFTVSTDGDENMSTEKGGHYHYDLESTKGEIEYEGWFNVAELLYRVDQP